MSVGDTEIEGRSLQHHATLAAFQLALLKAYQREKERRPKSKLLDVLSDAMRVSRELEDSWRDAAKNSGWG